MRLSSGRSYSCLVDGARIPSAPPARYDPEFLGGAWTLFLRCPVSTPNFFSCHTQHQHSRKQCLPLQNLRAPNLIALLFLRSPLSCLSSIPVTFAKYILGQIPFIFVCVLEYTSQNGYNPCAE